jgi:hypothetical protein
MKQKEFLKSGQYLISEVKTLAENGYSKYWFSADTMRFFNCRISELCWKINDKIYFISSEKQPTDNIKKYDRLYTIRLCLSDGKIKTVSEFQEYKTKNEARHIIKGILEDFEK